MSHEPLKESALFRTVSDVVTDLSDLFQKELRLAKAEISANVAKQLNAGIWMIAAALLGLIALLLVIQALVFGLIALGLAPGWACLIVALVLGGLGAAAFYKAKQDAAAGLTPERTVRQIKQDIKSTKEQLA